MSTIAIYVFFFMLVSSLLGIAVAWAWRQNKINQLSGSLEDTQKEMSQLQTQHDSLQKHSNQLEKEKEKLVYENERLTLKLSMLLAKKKSGNNKSSIVESDGFIDTSSLDNKINDLNAQINKLNEEIDIVKRESLEWQVQYSEILQEKEELAVKFHARQKPRN